ncbi:hypothetical protein HPB49_024979 [Dermacentor silvarum]|uniref:Uncharacterized protein n=1 Tax=Dermacentor silvarum TaxID=543639 RepID=A0ACB8CCD9_DERSI|nr:hypothetical protein HPB49_024979 [Dermacentor silvarum]
MIYICFLQPLKADAKPEFKGNSRAARIQGKFIPAGVSVMVTPWLIHHDFEIWPEPEKFLPDRFAAENSESRQNGTYMPFGLGPRVCIGQKLGFLALK